MMRSALNISPDEKVDEMPDFDESVAEEAAQEQPDEVNADEEPEVKAEVSF